MQKNTIHAALGKTMFYFQTLKEETVILKAVIKNKSNTLHKVQHFRFETFGICCAKCKHLTLLGTEGSNRNLIG